MILRQHKRPRAVTYGKYAPVRGRFVSLSDAQISRFYTFLPVGREERRIAAVLRAFPRITLSEPPSQTVTYDKHAPVCSGGSFVFFIGISRFYTFLAVGEGKKQGCRCSPRRSADSIVGAALANSHVLEVCFCPFGAALLFRLKVSPLFPAVNKMLGKVALRDYRVASAALRDGKSIAKRVGSEPNASRYDKGENYEQL